MLSGRGSVRVAEVRMEDEDYLIMKESDILGIIKGDRAAQQAA